SPGTIWIEHASNIGIRTNRVALADVNAMEIRAAGGNRPGREAETVIGPGYPVAGSEIIAGIVVSDELRRRRSDEGEECQDRKTNIERPTSNIELRTRARRH